MEVNKGDSIDFSIVIPVRNDSQRLDRCLSSLKLQRGRSELIVIDNASQDDSVTVATKCGATVLVYPDIRVGALRNRGTEVSTGRILAFVDSDHEVKEDWLEKAAEVLDSDSRILATGAFCMPPEDGTWVQTVWAIHRLRGPDRCEVDWLGSGNLFVRREAFERIGGFREDLIAAEDVDLCHRLRQLGGIIVCDKRIRNIHHGEPATLLAFIRKEYWRGSSGVKAWISQGFPLRDLPSLLWPLWHLVGGFVLAAIVIVAIVYMDTTWRTIAAIAMLAWLLPAILLSVRTCIVERRIASIPALAVLYFAYGLARAAALFR